MNLVGTIWNPEYPQLRLAVSIIAESHELVKVTIHYYCDEISQAVDFTVSQFLHGILQNGSPFTLVNCQYVPHSGTHTSQHNYHTDNINDYHTYNILANYLLIGIHATESCLFERITFRFSSLLSWFDISNPNPAEYPKSYTIDDECSLIIGIIHETKKAWAHITYETYVPTVTITANKELSLQTLLAKIKIFLATIHFATLDKESIWDITLSTKHCQSISLFGNYPYAGEESFLKEFHKHFYDTFTYRTIEPMLTSLFKNIASFFKRYPEVCEHYFAYIYGNHCADSQFLLLTKCLETLGRIKYGKNSLAKNLDKVMQNSSTYMNIPRMSFTSDDREHIISTRNYIAHGQSQNKPHELNTIHTLCAFIPKLHYFVYCTIMCEIEFPSQNFHIKTDQFNPKSLFFNDFSFEDTNYKPSVISLPTAIPHKGKLLAELSDLFKKTNQTPDSSQKV